MGLMRCRSCKWVNKEGLPHCRLNPPTVINHGNSAYPLVLPRDTWCSKHKFSFWKWLKRDGKPTTQAQDTPQQ